MSNSFITKKIVRGQNYHPEFHVIFDPLPVEELLSIFTTCKASGSINEAVEEELLRRINRQPIVVSTKENYHELTNTGASVPRRPVLSTMSILD